ncbi:MAG TPA: AMIN domain-containing protein, partial [Myxococcota bacterium]|nr:AMIN domain-containing protein [Myxococcota bacterium]
MKPIGLSALLVVAALFSVPAVAAEPASVDGVAISASGNSTVVQIRLSTASASYSIFRASNPNRLVVDITGAALGPAPEVSSGGLVSKAEFSTFQDGAENVRLTLFLTGDAQHEARVEGNSILLTLIPGTI